MNPVGSFLPHLETVISFLAAAFVGVLAWRFWRLVRPMRHSGSWRSVGGGVLFTLGWVSWTVCLFGLGALSIPYPFNPHGVIVPPPGSLGATLVVIVYLLLPVGVVLMAVGSAIWGLRLKAPHAQGTAPRHRR